MAQGRKVDTEFVEAVAEALLEMGVVDGVALRDMRIRKKYTELRAQGNTGAEARSKLADEFCLSEKRIEAVLYKKRRERM